MVPKLLRDMTIFSDKSLNFTQRYYQIVYDTNF